MQRTVQPIRAQIRFARAKGRCKKTSCKSKRLHVKSQGLLPVRSAAPLCMDVCIIVPPHTPVWPCVPLCTSVYPCQSLCTPVYPCIPLCTPVYPCVPLCMHTYCVPLWTPVHTCLPLFTPVYPCVPLCTPMYPCVPRCTPVSPCVPLYTYPCKKKSPPDPPPTIFKLRRAPARDANLRRLSASDRSVGEGGGRGHRQKRAGGRE